MQQTEAIGILVLVAISMIGALAITAFIMPKAYADANCDKAGFNHNKPGYERGNDKQCLADFLNGPKEPVRDCDHKNSFKDNNNDGDNACRERGND